MSCFWENYVYYIPEDPSNGKATKRFICSSIQKLQCCKHFLIFCLNTTKSPVFSYLSRRILRYFQYSCSAPSLFPRLPLCWLWMTHCNPSWTGWEQWLIRNQMRSHVFCSLRLFLTDRKVTLHLAGHQVNNAVTVHGGTSASCYLRLPSVDSR